MLDEFDRRRELEARIGKRAPHPLDGRPIPVTFSVEELDLLENALIEYESSKVLGPLIASAGAIVCEPWDQQLKRRIEGNMRDAFSNAEHIQPQLRKLRLKFLEAVEIAEQKRRDEQQE